MLNLELQQESMADIPEITWIPKQVSVGLKVQFRSNAVNSVAERLQIIIPFVPAG
jgi:hypothetical protein